MRTPQPQSVFKVTAGRASRKWLQRGAVLTLTLISMEIALQLLVLSCDRARYALHPWSPPPRFVEDDVLIQMGNPQLPEHDSNGFRNARLLSRAEIVSLGDSNTYGHRVRREEAWPQILARQLDLSVYNLGMSGWGPVQYRAVLPGAIALRPSVVIVCLYFGNDIWDSYNVVYNYKLGAALRAPGLVASLGAQEHLDPLAGRWARAERLEEMISRPEQPHPVRSAVQRTSDVSQIAALVRASRLLLLGRDRYGKRTGKSEGARHQNSRDLFWKNLKARAAERPGAYVVFEQRDIRTILAPTLSTLLSDDPRGEEGLRLTVSLVNEIATTLKRKGIGVLVVMLPTRELVFRPFLEAPSNRRLDLLFRWENRSRKLLLSTLDRQGVPYVDLLEALRGCIRSGVNPYFESDNAHINAAGQLVVAQAICTHSVIISKGKARKFRGVNEDSD